MNIMTGDNAMKVLTFGQVCNLLKKSEFLKFDTEGNTEPPFSATVNIYNPVAGYKNKEICFQTVHGDAHTEYFFNKNDNYYISFAGNLRILRDSGQRYEVILFKRTNLLTSKIR